MAILPPFFLDTVAAIGIGDNPEQRQWIGTGFLFGMKIHSIPTEKEAWRVWLVTNKHVIIDQHHIYLKFNSSTALDSKDYPLLLADDSGKQLWTGHQDEEKDVAVITINCKLLRSENRVLDYFKSDKHISTIEELGRNQVTEGEGVFVLGFPLSLVNPTRKYTICRGGTLARIRDCLEGRSSEYLIDASVFPGNSGGPVILCPSVVCIENTKPITKASLIGIVKSYIPYEDIAISLQTNKPKIIFTENSGLASVETVDTILETITEAERKLQAE